MLLIGFLTFSPVIVFGQNTLLRDNFKNNKNSWELRSNRNFLVAIRNGVLHLEKFEKNRIKNECLWYKKTIPGLNTQKDFSVEFYANFLSGGDIADMIDLQWGTQSLNNSGKITGGLYQLSFFMDGRVNLDYFDSGWSYFIKKNVQDIWTGSFKQGTFNKYKILQRDGLLIVEVNDKVLMKQLITPIAGNMIGFQQCLKSAWEIDNIRVIQGSELKKSSLLNSDTIVAAIENNVSGTNNEVSIFPNPFINTINVSFELRKPETVLFYLIDMRGGIIQQHTKLLKAGIQNFALYADVNPGAYILKVQFADKVISKTIIKQ